MKPGEAEPATRCWLFVCTHNAARSQMAEGLLRARYGGEIRALSAGVTPSRVHPLAIEAMREIGIDIRAQRSKAVDEIADQPIDLAITVCDSAKESCPYLPGLEHLHRSFADPSSVAGDRATRLAAFRTARDEIAAWLDDLVKGGGLSGRVP